MNDGCASEWSDGSNQRRHAQLPRGLTGEKRAWMGQTMNCELHVGMEAQTPWGFKRGNPARSGKWCHARGHTNSRVSRASRVSSLSRDSNTFQECFKRWQELSRVSTVSRACFKRVESILKLFEF